MAAALLPRGSGKHARGRQPASPGMLHGTLYLHPFIPLFRTCSPWPGIPSVALCGQNRTCQQPLNKAQHGYWQPALPAPVLPRVLVQSLANCSWPLGLLISICALSMLVRPSVFASRLPNHYPNNYQEGLPPHANLLRLVRIFTVLHRYRLFRFTLSAVSPFRADSAAIFVPLLACRAVPVSCGSSLAAVPLPPTGILPYATFAPLSVCIYHLHHVHACIRLAGSPGCPRSPSAPSPTQRRAEACHLADRYR